MNFYDLQEKVLKLPSKPSTRSSNIWVLFVTSSFVNRFWVREWNVNRTALLFIRNDEFAQALFQKFFGIFLLKRYDFWCRKPSNIDFKHETSQCLKDNVWRLAPSFIHVFIWLTFTSHSLFKDVIVMLEMFE